MFSKVQVKKTFIESLLSKVKNPTQTKKTQVCVWKFWYFWVNLVCLRFWFKYLVLLDLQRSASPVWKPHFQRPQRYSNCRNIPIHINKVIQSEPVMKPGSIYTYIQIAKTFSQMYLEKIIQHNQRNSPKVGAVDQGLLRIFSPQMLWSLSRKCTDLHWRYTCMMDPNLSLLNLPYQSLSTSQGLAKQRWGDRCHWEGPVRDTDNLVSQDGCGPQKR